jgi:hypothetical protein
MPLKLSALTNTEGKWCPYQDDFEIRIRPLFSNTIAELSEQARTGRMVRDPRTGKQVPEVDPAKLEELMTDYLVEDFKGLVDDQDPPQPVPVTLANKKALINSSAIGEFVWNEARALNVLPERAKNS